MNTRFLKRITSVFILLFVVAAGKIQGQLPGKALNLDSLSADIDLLEQALTEIHPGIYRYNSPEQITAHFKALHAGLYDGISEAEFMKQLAQTIVKIRCGHTYVNPWNMKSDLRNRLFGGATYFPLGFEIIDGRFFVTHNASEESNIKKGAEILSINAFPIQAIYDSLSTIAKSDGHNFNPTDQYLSLENFQVRSWQAFDLYFPLFFPSQESAFEIQYKNYGVSKVHKAQLKKLTKADREKRILERYGEKAISTEDWSLNVINADLAVMRLGTFAIWNWKGFDQKQWFADAFRKLDSLQIKHLVVDIRGNGGGLSDPRDELMSYLIKEKIECEDKGKVLIRTTKLNPDLVPYIDTWVEPLIQGLPPEYYSPYEGDWFELNEKSSCQDILPKANGFKGKTYIFGGASNVSATFTLIERARQFGFATVIGQPSGGNKQGINGGEYAFFYMPYSKMEVDIPLKYFAPSKKQADEGIDPDISVSNTQEAIAKEKDPYLEMVSKMIKQ